MIKKLRFIEAGAINRYQKTFKNRFFYNGHICNPSTGLITLATIAKGLVDDTLMYSESISELCWSDILDADVVFISINTYNAPRGYEIAQALRGGAAPGEAAPANTHHPLVVLGGLHASLNYPEAVQYADYVMLGDADESIVEFIQALQNQENQGENTGPNAGFAPFAPLTIPGLAYLDRTDSAAADPALLPTPATGTATPALLPGTPAADPATPGRIILTAQRAQPTDIETIPDRSLVYDYARLAKKYDTLWPQVHASRGCGANCDYCSVVAHFGHRVRTRSPECVVEDIRQAIAFHNRRWPVRLTRAVWLTDDNFAEDREWAKAVLKAIIASDITWGLTVQARWELGFDDELLELMRQAGFFEVSLGIEFIDDASFKLYHKRCTRERIEQAIANIQAHSIGVRGLFILGSDEDTLGIGRRLGQFVIANQIHGCLVQSMFFVPGTPIYEHSQDRLLHRNWQLFNGNVVHRPKNMTPAQLQQELIDASRTAYSAGRLLHALIHAKGVLKALAIGETLWHAQQRHEWRKQLPALRAYDTATAPATPPTASPAPATPPAPAA